VNKLNLWGLVGLLVFGPLSGGFAESIEEFEATIVGLISAGRQAEAEDLVENAAREIRGYQRYQLIDACLVQSRFEVEESTKKFADVILLYPYSEDGHLAYLVRDLDTRGFRQKDWDDLKKLAEKSKLGMWPKWMLGVEARNFDRNEEGRQIYQDLLSTQKVGSSLMHQTYANILDELDLLPEALEHRRLTIKLEDKSWSRDALANTLSHLNQTDEAIVNYQKALEYSPKDSNTMVNYSMLLQRLKKYDEALALLQKALEFSPDWYKVWYNIGLCLQAQGKTAEARGKFKKALELNPDSTMVKEALGGKG